MMRDKRREAKARREPTRLGRRAVHTSAWLAAARMHRPGEINCTHELLEAERLIAAA